MKSNYNPPTQHPPNTHHYFSLSKILFSSSKSACSFSLQLQFSANSQMLQAKPTKATQIFAYHGEAEWLQELTINGSFFCQLRRRVDKSSQSVASERVCQRVRIFSYTGQFGAWVSSDKNHMKRPKRYHSLISQLQGSFQWVYGTRRCLTFLAGSLVSMARQWPILSIYLHDWASLPTGSERNGHYFVIGSPDSILTMSSFLTDGRVVSSMPCFPSVSQCDSSITYVLSDLRQRLFKQLRRIRGDNMALENTSQI